jgi:hypothetical protein
VQSTGDGCLATDRLSVRLDDRGIVDPQVDRALDVACVDGLGERPRRASGVSVGIGGKIWG